MAMAIVSLTERTRQFTPSSSFRNMLCRGLFAGQRRFIRVLTRSFVRSHDRELHINNTTTNMQVVIRRHYVHVACATRYAPRRVFTPRQYRYAHVLHINTSLHLRQCPIDWSSLSRGVPPIAYRDNIPNQPTHALHTAIHKTRRWQHLTGSFARTIFINIIKTYRVLIIETIPLLWFFII